MNHFSTVYLDMESLPTKIQKWEIKSLIIDGIRLILLCFRLVFLALFWENIQLDIGIRELILINGESIHANHHHDQRLRLDTAE